MKIRRAPQRFLAIKQHSHVWESKKLNADKLEQNVSISIIIDKITITNFFQFLVWKFGNRITCFTIYFDTAMN